MMIYHFEEDFNPLIPSENEEEDVIEFEFLIKTDDYDDVSREMDKAYMDWMGGCKDSILYEADTASDDLSQIPIGDYICMWLDKRKTTYFDVTGKYGDLDYGQLSDPKFLEMTLEILKEGYPGALNYMSGTNGMLPTVFDIDQVPKNNKIHQAEKPVELLEQIITFISKPNEKILDQFCGSGVLGEAALNTGRDSIIIEKNYEAFNNACERVNRARHR
ncbi:MAG: DNA methyltransferase, partial [Lachnospiraceae bacterium]|nr:DNA methyltransferase [Lachnospiraceae bacterium]